MRRLHFIWTLGENSINLTQVATYGNKKKKLLQRTKADEHRIGLQH